MIGNAKVFYLWVTAIVLLLASAWSCNVGTYDLFAGDFPGPYRQAWARYGLVYLGFALIFFAVFLLVATVIVRGVKKAKARN